MTLYYKETHVTTGDSIHAVLIPDVVHFEIPGGSPLKNTFHEGDKSMKALIYKDTKMQIITHKFKLDDGAKAFETASDPSLAIKVVLDLE